MEQKFGHTILKSTSDQLTFDFNINIKNEFIDRLNKYDKILETIVKKEFLKDSFIAGGGHLIKYDENCAASSDRTKYKEYVNNSKMNVYIKIESKGKKYKIKGSKKTDLENAKKNYLNENNYEPNEEQNALYITISQYVLV
jgi:hypothetical protein